MCKFALMINVMNLEYLNSSQNHLCLEVAMKPLPCSVAAGLLLQDFEFTFHPTISREVI
jgi:hypothetical protein